MADCLTEGMQGDRIYFGSPFQRISILAGEEGWRSFLRWLEYVLEAGQVVDERAESMPYSRNQGWYDLQRLALFPSQRLAPFPVTYSSVSRKTHIDAISWRSRAQITSLCMEDIYSLNHLFISLPIQT